ncbi:MAG TPA: carboxypeptidase regulatory-like domain-containing protein [Bryobacteraceae bacterium]|nr:carboxypeptidase regulatory-like domain-containing protein [Bryobacteraceae bacterium]
MLASKWKPAVRWVGAMAVLAIAPHAAAQMNGGEIGGSVSDPLGGRIPGAAIVAQDLATGKRYTGASNTSGEYILPQLPVGQYSLRASAENFKVAEIATVEVHVGQQLRQDFALQVGDASEVVIVEGDTGVQLDSAEIKDVIQRQAIVNLPLRGRQFLDLATLSQGVVRPPGGTRGEALQQAGTLVNVLGQRSGHNLYLVDGVTVTDEYFNNMVISPSIDAMQEFQLLKTSYSPEFGGKSGAVINVITRAGTNRYSGSLFEFVRNSAFDAKNYFDSASAPIPPFRQNQFGATVGGPIVKNKLFFFLSYEGQQISKALTKTFSVPTDAMRHGNFAGLPPVYDPLSGGAAGRVAFGNNQIPMNRLDPAALALLALIPEPNLPGIGQNLLSVEQQRSHSNAASARVDDQITPADNLYFRASYFDARELDPFGSDVLQESLLPGFGRDLSTHSINAAAGWTHAFNAQVLNEFRFGALAVGGGQSSPNAGAPFAAANGLQGVTTNPADIGYPQFSFGGQFSTMGDPALFTSRRDRDIEIYDNVVWHRGTHTLRWGAYFMHFDFQPVNPNGARGIYSYTPRWTSSAPGLANGNAFADFLLGYPTTAQAGLGRAAMDARTNWGHFYVQDNWQLRPGLKVDAGLRYEYNQNMTDSGNQVAAIDPNVPGGRFVIASDGAGNLSPSASALLPLLPIPWVTSAAAGWSNSLLRSTGPRLAPRAGIAWNPPHSPKTVLRASFGIYPNQAAYSVITNLAQNMPFFVTKTASAPVAPLPAFTTETALAGTALGTVGGSDVNHDFLVEYNEVWNASVEREIAPMTIFSLTYVGSRTVHADSSTVLNVPLPGPGAIAARRPIPQMSQFNTIRWNGWAKYDALTANVTRRFARGLSYDVNWTWSHSIDDASDPGTTLNENNLPQNVYDTSSERASSSFDHRQRVVASFLYELPLAMRSRGWQGAAFARWRMGGSFTAQSGAPFTVNIASDQANIGAGPAQRPNATGDPNSGPKTPNEWFNTSVFSLPALYSFGNAPRNAVIGPGAQEFDISLMKEFPLGEMRRLEFRAEAYNLLNRPNFNVPNRMAFTPNFGTISSAQDSRQLQFALRFSF